MPKGQKTRERIVAEAASLFNQRGFEGSSMSELMEATGLEKGGIYRHFSSKEELAAEAFDYAWKVTLDTRMRDLDRIPNSIDKLKQFVANFVDRPRPPVPGGCPLLNTAVDADDGNPVLRDRALKGLRDWRDRLRSIISMANQAERSPARCGFKGIGHSDHLFLGGSVDDCPPGTRSRSSCGSSVPSGKPPGDRSTTPDLRSITTCCFASSWAWPRKMYPHVKPKNNRNHHHHHSGPRPHSYRLDLFHQKPMRRQGLVLHRNWPPRDRLVHGTAHHRCSYLILETDTVSLRR